MIEQAAPNQQENQNQNQSQIHIQKLYIKDASFEIPQGVAAFQLKWQPELNVELNTEAKKIGDDNTFDIILKVKCTVKCEDQIAFVAEAQQAGVFTIANIPDEQMQHVVGAYCPNILYPYLREAISDMVLKGGFPQLSLAPVNFEAMLQQQQAQQNSSAE